MTKEMYRLLTYVPGVEPIDPTQEQMDKLEQDIETMVEVLTPLIEKDIDEDMGNRWKKATRGNRSIR